MVLNLKSVAFIILLGLIVVDHGNAVCCTERVHLAHPCLGDSVRYCASFVCFDGTMSNDGNCGYGQCNIYGCNCDGGCRVGANGYNENEAKILFELKYNVISEFAS